MPIKKVKVAVSTSSQRMDWGSLPPPAPPKITLDGNPLPSPPKAPRNVAGWYLAVLDTHKDITTPAAILYNDYVALNSRGTHTWSDTYTWMYDGIVQGILDAGDVNAQLVILASFGLDANMPPTNEATALLFELGSGPALQTWRKSVMPGYEPGADTAYVVNPANYALIGMSAWHYAQGEERFDFPRTSGPVATTVEAVISNIVPV